jgi:hypothetical protein
MKFFILLLLLGGYLACQSPSGRLESMQNQIDSLRQQVHASYKSGLGEFMNGIQIHHGKLWFAGINRNWKLAEFEVQEIHEALDDIKTYVTDRPETKKIDMIFAPLDSLALAIQQQNVKFFKTSFTSLTATCNNCHAATDHAFNVITIPSAPPVTNQEFKPVLQ